MSADCATAFKDGLVTRDSDQPEFVMNSTDCDEMMKWRNKQPVLFVSRNFLPVAKLQAKIAALPKDCNSTINYIIMYLCVFAFNQQNSIDTC